ncbi:MAG: glycosyltransferase WbuB, partial [Actinobacteria bacterium]|nr:glycosyltransferase WbuB [Actinomycetota bacterium]
APTGTVMTRIVTELADRGHQLHVITALPWYREHAIEDGWGSKLWRTETTSWGSITRVHPFPGKSKSNLLRRALGFVAFSALVAWRGLFAGGFLSRLDGVIAMSPPLTLGLTGRLITAVRGGRLMFNIQDVFPDAAITTGAIRHPLIISLASRLEKWSYRASDFVVVLSDDLADNVRAKVSKSRRDRVRVIPNFVDTEAIVPRSRNTAYRTELGIGDQVVVMYAGNVGYSQSLDMVVEVARAMPSVVFVINGDGSARESLESSARGLANVKFADYQPIERLSEVLATGDIHLVPLRSGLARVSVPSKTYSIMASSRPVIAAIDPDTEIPRLLERSGAGVSVAPDDADALRAAITKLVDAPTVRESLGKNGREWVERHASPRAVAVAYEGLFAADR